MKRILTVILGIGTVLFLFQLNSCKENEGITEPNIENVSLTGQIDYPFTSEEISNITIGFGEEIYQPDTEGKFTLSCNPEAPGMAIVFNDEETPLLLSLIPNPKESKGCKIDVHSTALSLVFLDPFVCTSHPPDASRVIEKLEILPELLELENILISKLSTNLKAITTENTEVRDAVKNVIVSYLNSISLDSTKIIPKTNNIQDESVVISPVNIVSGHQVKHLGENNFTISNWYGRWAKCILPTDSIYLPPTNGLLSFEPWAASSTNFNLQIIPNEQPKEIIVYGLGMPGVDGVEWGSLSLYERDNVMFTSVMTAFIEFVPRALSLLTNFPVDFGVRGEDAQKVGDLIRYMMQSRKMLSVAELYISNGDYLSLIDTIINEFISLLITDDNFRNMVLKQTGIKLSEAAFKSIGIKLLLPLNTLYVADDLTGLLKTVWTLNQSSFRTKFKIYSEEYNFGNVNGNVFDKENGSPIQGARVQLTGDEDNPMNPNYIYTTDANGGFWFENIMEGTKSLLVSKSGYGAKTVEIEVKENEITKVTIQLSKEEGTLQGKVLNEIFIKNEINPPNFNKECHLKITDIGGNNQSVEYWIYESHNGEFSKNLLPGTYEIKVWHEDYKEAKDTVTIPGNQVTQMEDLILKPNCMMEGSVYYNIDFVGSYEYSYTFKADLPAGTSVINIGTCSNNAPRYGIAIAGLNDDEIIEILIDTAQIKRAHNYPLGGLENCGCEGLNGKTTVLCMTKRFLCTHEEYGYQQDLIFGYTGDPDNVPCSCGITDPGRIYISKYGTELGDVIEGSIVATLAGWNNCHCSCCDEDGNHTVDCATSKLDIKFKVLVGSLYDDMQPPLTKLANQLLKR